MNQPQDHPFWGGTPPDDALLLAYAEGRLSPDEAHAVEQWLATETPEADAIEGLNLLEGDSARTLQKRINSRVALSARRGNRRERRSQPMSQRWVLTAVVTVLALLVIAALYFFIFRK